MGAELPPFLGTFLTNLAQSSFFAEAKKSPSFQVPSSSWSRSLKCASCSDSETLEQEFEENPIHLHVQHIRAQQQL